MLISLLGGSYEKKVLISCAVLLVIGVVVVMVFNIEAISKNISNVFWNTIGQQSDKEEAKWRDYPYGRPGKDTVYWAGDGKFQILRGASDKELFMYDENKGLQTLLKDVTDYKVKKKFLYVISEEGYGVIDENENICRLFISIEDAQYISGWSEDEDGTRKYISRYLNDEHITYLKSYDEFSSDERVIFEGMKK